MERNEVKTHLCQFLCNLPQVSCPLCASGASSVKHAQQQTLFLLGLQRQYNEIMRRKRRGAMSANLSVSHMLMITIFHLKRLNHMRLPTFWPFFNYTKKTKTAILHDSIHWADYYIFKDPYLWTSRVNLIFLSYRPTMAGLMKGRPGINANTFLPLGL